MKDENERMPHDGQDREKGRRQSWLERTILPPREDDSWLVRELKAFARTGVLVLPILVLFEIGRGQGWW